MSEQSLTFDPITQRMIPIKISEYFDVKIDGEDSPFESNKVFYSAGIKLFTGTGQDPQLMIAVTINKEVHEWQFWQFLQLIGHKPDAQGDTDQSPGKSSSDVEVHTSNPGKQGIVAGHLKSGDKLIQVMAKEGESKSEAMVRVKKNHPGSEEVEHSPNPGWHQVEKEEVAFEESGTLPSWAIPMIKENVATFSQRLKSKNVSFYDWMKDYGERAMKFAPNLPIWKEM